MSVFLIAFLSSLLITMLVIRYQRLHSRFSADSDLSGIQKFHHVAVPRVGGLGILLAVVVAMAWRWFENSPVGGFGLTLALSALPAFAAGFFEDVTKRVGVSARLLATGLSAAFAGWLLGAWLSSLQVFGIDTLMTAYPWLAIVVTCFAVAGVANAFNIIDGYNGLSGMVGFIILAGIAYVAFQLSDYPVMVSSLALMGALIGFLFWNYPRGLIFLGDGGAYLLGFWIAELSVLLTARHPEVSKWFPLLLCFYPIFETLFTIYRRVFVLRTHPGMPDAAHLHQIIYKRLVRWAVGSSLPEDRVIRNALTAPYLWILTSVTVIPAVLFWRHAWLLQGFALAFAVGYVLLYRMIVRFRSPRWLTLQRRR